MFPDRLKQARKKTGLTQQKIADNLGISLNAYQKYEQAERSPSLDTLVKLADLLGVTTDYLLGRTVEAISDVSQTILQERPISQTRLS